MKMKNEELRWLLDIANDLRKAAGDDPLEDLPASYPNEANECLIANAVNYGAEISPNDEAPGYAYFDVGREEDAKRFRDTCWRNHDEVPEIEESTHPTYHTVQNIKVPLTPELNRVALNFDKGHYNEYNIYAREEE